ncbi:hypothetical protein HYFRA_00000121 [Hymenoscyphus fraxineus]|uniref:PH domain-containing protein n=1 Tax=Hymenoscyphus fraxineus TaxID=746836 RepID=A0A9N9L435_9HELO|nr:hypothetical protein HYFRA_00000121 [Hymenoscyphus fraxineus]
MSTIPAPSQGYTDRGYGANSLPQPSHNNISANDFGSAPANPAQSSPLAQSSAQPPQNRGRFNEEWDASQRGSSIVDGHMQRPSSAMSSLGATLIPSRGGTLKKKGSIKRSGSLRRSGSRRSSRAGSVRSLALHTTGAEGDEAHSAFFSPVPTSGNPTEILANRFQSWRKVLKDLITYFREIQASYDHKSKTLLKISNVINNTSTPPMFLQSGGIDDALQILRGYHKNAIAEANKSKDIENDVILSLVGLRNDLNQKIKEIKSLSGDFKNSVDKEMENTRRSVNSLQEGLGQADIDPSQMTGKQDPYLLKLAVDRQIEKQIDEENYLHQAYLNLEASGRELESIVVGEIQKSYNAYAGILKREADSAYDAIEELRTGPISMPKDHEWQEFVEADEHFVDPKIPVREAHNIHYPGRDNYLAQAIREGLLERKSKYLKSYTPGWYVLSPTHLHEFKSADKTQAPIMSLYLPEQKLGSNSTRGASSNKFMLKGRQTGSMHRGHSWVFRAESYDTMISWVEDVRTLTEKSPQERNAFVRQHARSVSNTSQKAGSISSDGVMDEEDEEPFSANASSVVAATPTQDGSRRPQAGGRFPSDLQVNTQRGLQAPLSASSGSSNIGDAKDSGMVATTSALPDNAEDQYGGEEFQSHADEVDKRVMKDGVNPYTYEPIQETIARREQQTAPTAGLGGVAVGAAGFEAYNDQTLLEKEAAQYDYFSQQQLAVQAAREATMIAAPDNEIKSSNQPPQETNVPAPVAMSAALGDVSETSQLQDTLAGETPLVEPRPLFANAPRHESVQSISQLHVPGGYPRSTTELKSPSSPISPPVPVQKES